MTSTSFPRLAFAFLLLTSAIVLAGCSKPVQSPVKPPAPDVFVETPTTRGVTDFEEFTGRTEAIRILDVRPEVTGRLKAVHFIDGAFVREGEPLFDIDDELYRAQRDSAAASLEVAVARVTLNTRLLASAAKGRDSSAIAMDEYVRAEAELKVAQANEKFAEAHLKETNTTLGYTKIVSRYTGRISRRMADPGNIVKANETLLTRVVVLDPMYVSFDIDERTVLMFRKLISSGKIASRRDSPVNVQVGLADEEGYQYQNVPLVFSDNQLDLNTGTLRLRAEMKNPDLQFQPLPALVGSAAALGVEHRGVKLLSPGMFVRVRMPVGKEHPGVMIPEEALGSDQGSRYVYVVNDKDEAVYRRVKLGPQEGKLRVIDEGIALNERVIVSGLQRVRAGMKVNPKMSGPTPKEKK